MLEKKRCVSTVVSLKKKPNLRLQIRIKRYPQTITRLTCFNILSIDIHDCIPCIFEGKIRRFLFLGVRLLIFKPTTVVITQKLLVRNFTHSLFVFIKLTYQQTKAFQKNDLNFEGRYFVR